MPVRSLSESTSVIKIALLFLCISFIIFIVGFSTTHWRVFHASGFGQTHIGLWQQCHEIFQYRSSSICVSISYGNAPSWYSVVQALQCVGLVGFILTLAGTLLNIFVVRQRSLKQAAIFIIFMSGLAILVGCGYFAVKTELAWLGYSYSLACVGGCGAIFVAFLLCIDVRKERDPPPTAVVQYNPGQPTPAVYTTPSGPYGGQILAPPPSAPPVQVYQFQGQPQYTGQGYTSQGQPHNPSGYVEPVKS